VTSVALLGALAATLVLEGAALCALRLRLPRGAPLASVLVNGVTNPLANLAVGLGACPWPGVEAGVVAAEAGLFALVLGCAPRPALATSVVANAPTILATAWLWSA